jgi:vancomycin resistance protein YoaR
MMPGDKFSFNQIVGRRTVEAGYKEAPVFVNGRVDSGVGGGICQVSTTLYNSILLAGLKVVERRNHSLPVHYMSIGRDATVSYGTTDLQFQNPFDHPIAISRRLERGRITITVFGKKPEYTYKIVSGPRKSWANKTTYVIDKSLRPGRKVVREAGSPGYSVRTYRDVFQGGKLVRREDLGLSRYSGGPTVIAHNPTGSSTRTKRKQSQPIMRGPLLPGATAAKPPKSSGPVVPQRRG